MMAKKKIGAKKVARKTPKQVPQKPVLVVEPDPVEVVSPPSKPKVDAATTVSEVKVAKVVQGAIAERRWPGIEKGYPDPFDVENEFTTATHRIFVFKKEPKIWEKYKTRKKSIPLD